MLDYIKYFNEHFDAPSNIFVILLIAFFILQCIGEILELTGKIVPEFFKVRKFFNRKKMEKKDVLNTLKDVKQLLSDVNMHYSSDNITKRDKWMEWVNERAKVYDDSIVKVGEISKDLVDVTKALNDCTKMSEEMFVQDSRDRIIDFAAKAGNKDSMVTKEEFNRIFKVHSNYEKFLKEHGKTNGEVDIAYRIIEESYEDHMKNHTFIEDIRGYNV